VPLANDDRPSIMNANLMHHFERVAGAPAARCEG
jgi:hypothetical protein